MAGKRVNCILTVITLALNLLPTSSHTRTGLDLTVAYWVQFNQFLFTFPPPGSQLVSVMQIVDQQTVTNSWDKRTAMFTLPTYCQISDMIWYHTKIEDVSLIFKAPCTQITLQYLFTVVDEQPVPGIDLRGLLKEYCLLFFQFQCPFVDGLFKLSECHRGRWLASSSSWCGNRPGKQQWMDQLKFSTVTILSLHRFYSSAFSGIN